MQDILYFVSLAVVSLSLISSGTIIVCYTLLYLRAKQNPILIVLSPHLEAVTSVAIATFLTCLCNIFPVAAGFVLTEDLVNDYHNNGWPPFAYIIIPLGTFSMVSSWLWLAMLPNAIHWSALSQPGDASPVELIHRLHRQIWPLGVAVALFESLNLFVIKPEPALRLHDCLMAIIGLMAVIVALTKYTRFSNALNVELAATTDYLVPSNSNLGDDEPRIYMCSLLRRALLYMFSFLIIWGPVFLAHLSCAIRECDEFGTRIQTLISSLQGLLLVLIFWYQEDIKGLLCRPQMTQPAIDPDIDYYPEYLLPSASNLQKIAANNGYDVPTVHSLTDTRRSATMSTVGSKGKSPGSVVRSPGSRSRNDATHTWLLEPEPDIPESSSSSSSAPAAGGGGGDSGLHNNDEVDGGGGGGNGDNYSPRE